MRAVELVLEAVRGLPAQDILDMVNELQAKDNQIKELNVEIKQLKSDLKFAVNGREEAVKAQVKAAAKNKEVEVEVDDVAPEKVPAEGVARPKRQPKEVEVEVDDVEGPTDLYSMNRGALKELGQELGIKGAHVMKKDLLIEAIIEAQGGGEPTSEVAEGEVEPDVDDVEVEDVPEEAAPRRGNRRQPRRA